MDQVVDHVGGDDVDGPDGDEPADRERPARVLVLAVRRRLVVINRHDQQHLRANTEHSPSFLTVTYSDSSRGLACTGPWGVHPNP